MEKKKNSRMGKRRWNRMLSAVLMSFVLVLLTGCVSREVPDPMKNSEEQKDSYDIYFTTPAGNELVTVSYYSSTPDKEELASELVAMMFTSDTVGGANAEYVSVFGPGDTVTAVSIHDRVASVHFSSYTQKEAAPEVLMRAALAKTLCSLDGVDYVSMLLDEQPMMNGDQTSIGYLSSSDYVTVVGRNVNNYKKNTYTLYFSNEDGTKLVEEKMEITYSSTFSLESYVMERLIEGPETEGAYRSLPSNLRVLSISVKEGICYLNLDDSFVENAPDVDAGVVIYSVVNSLTELPNVSSVRIMVNGEGEINYKDAISLKAPLERNLDYVQEDETEEE